MYFFRDATYFQAERVNNIALILRKQNNDYWKSVRRGAEAAAKEYNVKVDIVSPNDEKDYVEQIDLINQAIKRKVEALIIAPNDYNKLAGPVENAISHNIPVLTIDSEINSKAVTSYIATNNFNAGENLGKKVTELAGEVSKIAIINAEKNTTNFIDREQGLMDMLAKYPYVWVAATEYNSLGIEGAVRITENIITNNKNVSAIVALDSESSIGAAQVIDRMELAGKIKVIAFDSEAEEINYLESGRIEATVVQSPFSMGYLSVKNAVLVLQGKKIPKYIDTGLTVIDKENMYLPANEKILFPFTQ
jgi:ribose transport system substrate-binding protein